MSAFRPQLRTRLRAFIQTRSFMASYGTSVLAAFEHTSARLAAAHLSHVARDILAQLVLAVTMLFAKNGARRAACV